MEERPAFTRWQRWALLAALGVAWTLLTFWYKTLDRVTWGMSARAGLTLLEQFTGVFTVVALLPAVVWMTRHYVPERRRWRWLPAHVAAFAAWTAAHTTLMWGTRLALAPLLGLGPYHYGLRMPVRYLMEAGSDANLYMTVVIFVILFDRWRAAQRKELELARVQTKLAEARLHALQAQIHPHFLFNTLNTISSVMYEDVVAADAMISGLGELLRRTLAAGAAEVPLAEELRLLELYLDIMQARFEGGLDVRLSLEDDVRDAAVPPLLLQPLVENAIRHGTPAPPEPARIVISAARLDGLLRLEVRDNGAGVPDPANPPANGVGLANTAERLKQLHGEGAHVELANDAAGGLRVTVTMPYRPMPVAEPDGRGAPVAGGPAVGSARAPHATGERAPWTR